MKGERGGRVGRSAVGLEAAIERFGLDARIAGSQALDLGTATGGFAAALLAHGAAHVTAVGEGRLQPSLRADKRITGVEGVPWKTLPASTAPGPFDFFIVEAGLLVAGDLLRRLASRLRPGAEGLVVVKPDDPRRDALAELRKKGAALGLQLVTNADTPVAHLRFAGRAPKLPPPPAKPDRDDQPRPAPTPAPTGLAMFAVAAPGVEPVLAREVAALPGVRDVKTVPGGVEFAGSLDVLYRANLWLRTATRVLVRVGTFEAREFPKMRRRAATLPWERFLDAARPVTVSAAQSGSRLYHTGGIAENLTAAIGDRLHATLPEHGDSQKVLVRGVSDVFTVSVDSSGELLHRRGWRQEIAHAPLRETLAAALLLLCGWDPTTPLVDPMCGAGTLPLEACAIAMRIAPGLSRRFAFASWPTFDAARWAALHAEAEAARLPAPAAPIVGSDRSPAAITAAQHNAERAGLAAHLTLTQSELDELQPPPGPGTVLMNPPYGRRLGDPRALRSLYGAIGRALRARFAGWRAALLVSDARLIEAVGARVVAEHPLSNGGLRVRLLELDLGKMRP